MNASHILICERHFWKFQIFTRKAKIFWISWVIFQDKKHLMALNVLTTGCQTTIDVDFLGKNL